MGVPDETLSAPYIQGLSNGTQLIGSSEWFVARPGRSSAGAERAGSSAIDYTGRDAGTGARKEPTSADPVAVDVTVENPAYAAITTGCAWSAIS